MLTVGDVIVLSVLVLIMGAVILGMVKKKKTGCGCGSCKGCSMAGSCHMLEK